MNQLKRGITVLGSATVLLTFCACGGVKDMTGSAGAGNGAAGMDLSYESETDCQIGIGQLPGRTYISDGAYFIEDGEQHEAHYLKFYDSATERIVYVCSKSNCNHNDADCMAYLDNQEYPLPYIWYYDGSLYVPRMDGDYIGMEKIALDGSTREDSCTLMRTNTEKIEDIEYTYYPELTVHRGYVYFTTYYPGNESADFCRVKLDSEEELEVLYSLKGTAAMIIRLKPYGGHVFFQAGIYEEGQDIGVNIYKYNIKTNETEEYYPGVLRDYVPDKDRLYYLSLTNSIYKADPVTKEDRLFYEPDNSDGIVSLFIKDDELIWQRQDVDVVEDRPVYVYKQTVLDSDGNVIRELSGTQDDWYSSAGNLLSPY